MEVIKKFKRLIIPLIFISLFFPKIGLGENNGTINAYWLGEAPWSPKETENSIKSILLDNDRSRDDKSPRWVPDNRRMVVYKRERKAKISEVSDIKEDRVEDSELSDIDEDIAKIAGISNIPNDKTESPELCYIDEDGEITSLYEGEVKDISWIQDKEKVRFIFTSGNDLKSGEISTDNHISSLLSIEKKVTNEGIVYLRHSRTKKLFYSRDGRIIGTSTNIDDNGWSPIVNTNGDCSRNKKVVFTSNLDSNGREIYTFELPQEGEDLDLSIIRRLTFSPEGVISPKWSPDGKSIVYASGKDIYLIQNISTSGMNPIRLTTNTTTDECSNPTFSPDGKMIAYYSTNGKNIYDLWVMKSNGEERTKVADNVLKPERHGDIYGPCWIPYGTSALIYLYNRMQNQIEVLNVTANSRKMVKTEEQLISNIDSLYVSDKDGQKILIVYSAWAPYPQKEQRIYIKEFKAEELPR
ncbi:MAG: DPP IV N-terminal domain-containing protein [bacterium]